MIEAESSDVLLGPSVSLQDRCMLAGKDEEVLGLHTYAGGYPHLGAERGEDAFGRAAELVVILVGRKGRKHRHGALLGQKPPLHVQRCPSGSPASFSAMQ